MKPLVYIASPYTKGDPAINTRYQCEIADKFITDGIVLPYAPLMSHFQHTIFPRPYQDWVQLDLEILHHCSALIRLDAMHQYANGDFYHAVESKGADAEVKYMEEVCKKPVFDNIAELYEWAATCA